MDVFLVFVSSKADLEAFQLVPLFCKFQSYAMGFIVSYVFIFGKAYYKMLVLSAACLSPKLFCHHHLSKRVILPTVIAAYKFGFGFFFLRNVANGIAQAGS